MVTRLLVGHTDILYGDPSVGGSYRHIVWCPTRLLVGHTGILYGDLPVGGSYRHNVW